MASFHDTASSARPTRTMRLSLVFDGRVSREMRLRPWVMPLRPLGARYMSIHTLPHYRLADAQYPSGRSPRSACAMSEKPMSGSTTPSTASRSGSRRTHLDDRRFHEACPKIFPTPVYYPVEPRLNICLCPEHTIRPSRLHTLHDSTFNNLPPDLIYAPRSTPAFTTWCPWFSQPPPCG